MIAKEYLLDIGFDYAHLPELFNNDDKSYYQITELMEEYHQAKLKLLGIGGVIGRLLFRAEKVFGDKYDRFSIQIEEGEAHLIGHEEIPYEADWEHKLCNVSELLNDL